MSKGTFIKGTAVTFTSGIIKLLIGVGTSVVLARVLGPEGRGVYALAMLLPSLIVTFCNLGIGSATVYYVARKEFRCQEILGNNVLLSVGIGGVGILAGLVVVFFFGETVFPGVPTNYLLLALVLVPIEMFFSYVIYVLLGAQRIKEFNYIQIVQSIIFLGFIVLALLGLRAGVSGAILAVLLTWLIVDVLVFYLVKRVVGGMDLRPNTSYMKQAATYGAQVYLGNNLWFLNLRVDMFFVNGFLGSAAAGLYSVGVGLVEKLGMVPQAASTVLFPRVAAETEEQRQKEFTPLVARTVLWVTAAGALVMVLFSRWIILLLYSEAFLPAVSALQALLVGTVALSASQVLFNDIAGRGHPILNIYAGLLSLIVNIILNIVWIPKHGIIGAAWASTMSYSVNLLATLLLYCRLSGNRWTKILLPQRGDWTLYWRTGLALSNWMKEKVRVALQRD